MRRVLCLVSTLVVAATLAACSSPMSPDFDTKSCLAGKVPYAACANRDYVNPLGDYVNPLGDYVNPLGDDTTSTGP
jgi:hypothetical protein